MPSAATRDDVIALYSDVSENRVDVIPHGIKPATQPTPADCERVRTEYALGESPFVLHVGTIQARKNVDKIIRAVQAAAEEMRAPA